MHPLLQTAGGDAADATCSTQSVPDFAAGLQSREQLQSRPLEGTRVGVVMQMMGDGVAAGVTSSVQHAVRHLESLGASIQEVSQLCCTLVFHVIVLWLHASLRKSMAAARLLLAGRKCA